MDLSLIRSYHREGTNGKIYYQNRLICESIELPWRNNRRCVSCIPEGRYRLVKKQHFKHGLQLSVQTVPNRENILIHPANFALRDLKGCIAPVGKCSGPGTGDYSRIALERLQSLIYPALDAEEAVYLSIKSTPDA